MGGSNNTNVLSLPKSSWFQNHHEFDISGSAMVKNRFHPRESILMPGRIQPGGGHLHMDRERPAVHFDPDPWSQPENQR